MIKVLKAGFYTSIQDKGRVGFSNLGVPVSGVMDSYSSDIANSILDNSLDDAVLEIDSSRRELAGWSSRRSEPAHQIARPARLATQRSNPFSKATLSRRKWCGPISLFSPPPLSRISKPHMMMKQRRTAFAASSPCPIMTQIICASPPPL